MTDHPDPAPPRRRLPDVALPTATGGAPVPLRARRRGTVLVLLPPEVGARERAYLAALADAEEELRGWDGRVLVVLASQAEAEALGAPASLPVVVDREGVVAAAAEVRSPAVIVVDQWGEAHVAAPVDERSGWLATGELEQWLRFLSIRCAG